MSQRDSTPPAIHVRFPDRFQGLFARSEALFAPMLVEGRTVLGKLRVRREFRPFYEYGVLEHAQPSFMLLPLMYLALARDAGGITLRHREYLPWVMLAMEACAILDDTVDHTPYRSGRMTYARRFGNESAAPFASCLVSMVYERTAVLAPELIPLVADMFTELCALEVWEHESRYPSTSAESLSHWLTCRYAEVTPSVRFGLDSALLLHRLPALPLEVSERFAAIFQDVDDLVNFVEQREKDGENDDVKLGMVTHPLVAAVSRSPELATRLEAFWSGFRASNQTSGRDNTESAREYSEIAQIITVLGVPVTVAKIVADADACVAATPEAQRSIIREMVQTFVDRLRRSEPLRVLLDLHTQGPALKAAVG